MTKGVNWILELLENAEMRAYSIFFFNAGGFTHALMFKVSVNPTVVKEKIEQAHISAFPNNSEIQLTPFVMEL